MRRRPRTAALRPDGLPGFALVGRFLNARGSRVANALSDSIAQAVHGRICD